MVEAVCGPGEREIGGGMLKAALGGAMRSKGLGNKIDESWKPPLGDLFCQLNDESLLNILRRLSPAPHYALVCKRWMRLHGSLRQSIKVQDWTFLESGRIRQRFPNLTDVDLSRACMVTPPAGKGSAILLTHQGLTVQLNYDAVDSPSIECCIEEQQLSPAKLDKGLKLLADTYPGLQRLCVVDVRRGDYFARTRYLSRTLSKPKSVKKARRAHDSDKMEKAKSAKEARDTKDGLGEALSDAFKRLKSDEGTLTWNMNNPFETPKSGVRHLKRNTEETGIASIAKKCPLLQELDLYQCTDETLRAIADCDNLQIVRLIGSITGFYHCTFTDIGLTIMSHTFRRLVSLELSGCEASYEGISAIGKCCVMLEELTLSNKGFYEGWVAALSFLACLKTLRLEGCKQIDRNPGPYGRLGRCSTIERLHLERCDLRDRIGFAALLAVCAVVKELEFKDCWGLDDDTLALTVSCKRVRLLSLEGCSLVTTAGVDSVVQSFKDLNRFRVTFCDNIRDSELSPALCDRFLTLKEFSWRPDTKSVLNAGLAGTGVGRKGGRFFRKS
ncbi:F-box protein At5g51370 [Physcomitrium patens]|uniref:F-box domain-containing protein n=1 Tax=Physcomitrium patens TaxID=3218 RepID=A0A2K1JY35_PHYPA|nr:F-box protein At5g51380-like [Physcomitrium patens]PNR46438.1 hypothetical protein PHYPA_013557 [Physcomitrium patens]|eukprot:XP_024385818.1 F-box protein At5g51380-like [Physcomitrella patens]